MHAKGSIYKNEWFIKEGRWKKLVVRHIGMRSTANWLKSGTSAQQNLHKFDERSLWYEKIKWGLFEV